MNISEIKKNIGKIDYKSLYCTEDKEKFEKRFEKLLDGFFESFNVDGDIRLFSAPGRTEIGGNHTDHQHGAVVAGSLNLDVIAAVRLNGTDEIRIKSEGFPMDVVSLKELKADEKEYGNSSALIRGVAAQFVERGYDIKGFDAYTTSNVLKGSGMSSSAAFEVIVGTIMNEMFANGDISAVEIAKIGQYAENVFFGKPCGCLDQTACASGGMISIDFKDPQKPIVKKINFDFAKANHALCIIDSGADHANLTDEYAAITVEMRQVANFFGKDFLVDVSKEEFISKLKDLRNAVNNDRAILRAIHFLNETERAKKQAKALENNNFAEFLKLIKESGQSSYMYLQNVYASKYPTTQAVSLALALCGELLGDEGAYRVHGGGFAGTIQAFVPLEKLEVFKTGMDAALGEGMCHVLSVRPIGGCEIKIQ